MEPDRWPRGRYDVILAPEVKGGPRRRARRILREGEV